MCVIPYGTQEGEISFCAYNTGVGWRQIIENMHKTANLADWYKENERHPVYAAGHDVRTFQKALAQFCRSSIKILAEDSSGNSPIMTPHLVKSAKN
jgi:hypothetical protein